MNTNKLNLLFFRANDAACEYAECTNSCDDDAGCECGTLAKAHSHICDVLGLELMQYARADDDMWPEPLSMRQEALLEPDYLARLRFLKHRAGRRAGDLERSAWECGEDGDYNEYHDRMELSDAYSIAERLFTLELLHHKGELA